MSFIDEEIAAAMSVKLDFDVLPEKATFQRGIRRAPDRGFRLTQAQTEIALKNALRYILKIPPELIPEFLEELKLAVGSIAIASVKRSHLWKTNR